MHGFTRGLERRLRALELRLGTVAEPELPAATARRAELVRAALAGEIPEDLTATERPTFEKILRYAPIALELRDEGLVGDDGRPGGGDDPHHEDEDEDGDDQAPVWHP